MSAGATRLVAAAVVGNALEWFDFTVYGLFAAMIARTFFPADNEIASLLLAFATFGVGFVLRPIGAVVLGHYADRSGRRPALSLIILLMSIGTALIAFTPGAARIGIAAPLLIVLARLIQGFSVGGELGGATAFLIESAPPGRRGLYASWQFAGQAAAAIAGSFCGVVLSSILPPDEIDRWGWRIPFALGLAIAPVGLYLRARMPDSLAPAGRSEHAPIVELWREHRRAVAVSFGVTILGTATTYIAVFYMPTYATKLLGIPFRESFAATTVSSFLLFALNPLSGRLSDRIGRARIMVAAAIGLMLLAYPLFRLLTAYRDAAALVAVQCVLTALLAMYNGAGAALIGEMFPARVRSTGIAIGYNVAVPIFGGFASYFVTRLDIGDHLAPAWYIVACAVPSLVALAALRGEIQPAAVTAPAPSMPPSAP